jgi:hypothetical protein
MSLVAFDHSQEKTMTQEPGNASSVQIKRRRPRKRVRSEQEVFEGGLPDHVKAGLDILFVSCAVFT